MEGVDRLNELKDGMLVNNIMSRLDCTTKEIRYAIRRNVEEVDLWLFDVGVGQDFTFEDETRMTLSFCRFNPPNGAISWERLESLCLSCVILDDNMIGKIISGSHCLESLELGDCHGFRRID
ncbi:ribonuclease H-like domain-containing protein, partial [Tanacetum coccineum]